MGLLWPKCRIWCLALLNPIPLASAQPIPIPLKVHVSLRQINITSQLGVVCKLTEGTFNPSSRSSIKVLNKIGLSTYPWVTPLVTGRQPDLTPLTTTHWARPSSQFFTQRRLYTARTADPMGLNRCSNRCSSPPSHYQKHLPACSRGACWERPGGLWGPTNRSWCQVLPKGPRCLPVHLLQLRYLCPWVLGRHP